MKKIDHVAIMVPNLEAALPFWSDVIGLSVSHIETVESEGVKVVMLPQAKTHRWVKD